MTVREFITKADRVLAGDTITGLSIADATIVASQLKVSFLSGPSAWAQVHLRPGGELNVMGEVGELKVTRSREL